jgi:hypothetical protein
MPQRAPSKQAAPAVVLGPLTGGYDGYTDPTQAPYNRWAAAVNIYTGAFGYLQRCRFSNVLNPSPTQTNPFTSMKFFALPGLSAYLLADVAGFLYSYDTGSSYAQTQRISPYWDPAGAGTTLLNGPWSREFLENIVYEMNGQVKQSGRLANAATIEGWGLDAPDVTPQIGLSSGTSQAISSITRANGIVTATLSSAYTVPTGSGGVLGFNVTGVTDTSYNGSFVLTSGNSTTTFVWSQPGQNSTSSGGTVNDLITKAVGRSYAYAWENANKVHVGAPSPSSQYILYNGQYGNLDFIESGTVATSDGIHIVGTNTAFSTAWVGRNLWIATQGGSAATRIVAVTSATALQIQGTIPALSGQLFQVYDPQSTHVRIYASADGGAIYYRIGRNSFTPSGNTVNSSGLAFVDPYDAEPPNFPYTTETSQVYNVPPPIGAFVNEYQGVLCIYGISGALQSFFYSNQTATTIGLLQESFCPLNQITLPIQNGQMNGMLQFPGAAIIWSNKQDMFRLTGLLTDNTVTGVAQSTSATSQGATIARLPYALGCASPFAVALTPLGGFWLTPNAEIWLYTDTYAPKNVGRPVQDILNSISPANLSLARMKYYHTGTRNWLAVSVAAQGSSYNNTVLVLDLDLLASNGSPSYFTFDMATNAPSWFVWQPGTQQTIGGVPTWVPRCDCLEHVYEAGGFVRLMVGQVNLIQDIDAILGGYGTEIQVPNGTVTTHAWGNDTAFVIKRPGWVRFNTNRDPSMLATDGWSFQAIGIDDDFYTFFNPLVLALTPGVNDSSSLGGNPDFYGGLAFRHSPELYKIGGVNFVMGRRLRFQVNFPSAAGVNYQLRGIQMGFDANGPS